MDLNNKKCHKIEMASHHDQLCSRLATLLPPTVGRVHLRIGVEVPDPLDVDNHQLVARPGGEEEDNARSKPSQVQISCMVVSWADE